MTVNFLGAEEAGRQYRQVLSPGMPVQALRMFFCRSFSAALIQHVSGNYSQLLRRLHVVDAVVEPTLRYHNALRHDAEPDPLVLLCWRCARLEELVVIGYVIRQLGLTELFLNKRNES